MSKQKHTPGPWEVCTEQENPPVFSIVHDTCPDQGGDCVYVIEAGYQADMTIKDFCFGIPSEADANLIAAAPELLEALEALLDYEDGIQKAAAEQMARAAIAKAGGES